MEENLFSRYTKVVQKNQEEKNSLIESIYKQTSVLLQGKEIIIEKKKVTIQTSSVKKAELYRKKVKEVLQEKGYTLSF